MSSATLFRAAIVAVPLAAIAYSTLHYTIALSRYAGGRTPGCSLQETLDAARESRWQVNRENQLGRQGRTLRREGDLVLLQSPHGEWWVPAGSEKGFYLEAAEQQRDLYRTATLLRPNDVVLDCGANVGIFARTALARGARVIAIEPVPLNLAALKRNLATEIAQGRVVVYEKGVWDRDDVLPMNIDRSSQQSNSFVRGVTGDVAHLPLTTIDRVVDELRLERVDFIKMDIEGAERRALHGAKRTLKRFRPRLAICAYHLSDDPVEIPKAVAESGQDYQTSTQCEHTNLAVSPQVLFFF